VKEPPSGDECLHELKFDGYRMLCRIDRGRVTVWSRNGKDWTEKFQNFVEAVKSLKATSAMLDGEIVIVDAQGRSSFSHCCVYLAESHLRAGDVSAIINCECPRNRLGNIRSMKKLSKLTLRSFQT